MILERHIDNYNFEDNLIELIDWDSYESIGIGFGRVWQKKLYHQLQSRLVIF